MHRFLNFQSKNSYTDIEVVIGLQSRNPKVEKWYYYNAKQYFMNHFNKVFFDKELKNTIFQDSFMRLWTQIENGIISVENDVVCRQQRNGSKQPMACSLNTFLFSIAKNEYREVVRSSKEIYVNEYFDSFSIDVVYDQGTDGDDSDIKIRIVDECIQKMPPRCLEILSLFYIEGKSLDEIMEIRKDKNSSKGGLKSAKYKCMNTLREKISEMFNHLNLTI